MSVIEPYLDEYLVAADLLDESNMPQVAAAVREASHRIIESFKDRWTRSHGMNLAEIYVKDSWAYITDGRILIRIKTSKGDTPTFAIDRGEETLSKILDCWRDSWDENDIEDWIPFPPVPDVTHEDEYFKRYVEIDQRRLSLWLLKRIHLLPNAEYGQQFEDYQYEPMFMAQQPILFRFRCGEGIAMPMKWNNESH